VPVCRHERSYFKAGCSKNSLRKT